MISRLSIQNFALFDSVEIDLSAGLNVLTGETGAGKTIVIDGLRFLLGERINTSQIRDPKKTCVVEAVFELPEELIKNSVLINENVTEIENNTLIISRSYLPDGKNRIKINGYNLTVSQLKALGDILVDFHGPHDHQMLLSPQEHLNILDRLSGIDGLKNEYDELYAEFRGLTEELRQLEELASSRQRDIELLKHQVNELSQVPLNEKAYEELLEKQKRINNSEEIQECAARLLEELEAENNGMINVISNSFLQARSLSKADPSAERFMEKLKSIQELAHEFSGEIKDYLENVSFQPQEAQEINNRADIYYDIKRKYGPGLKEAESFYEEAKKKLEAINDFEHNSSELTSRITELKEQLQQLAQKITRKRKNTAQNLKETIEKELKELGIMHVRFECRVEKTELSSSGQDNVLFYISPNAGEELKPLAEIVSSGEAARLMLALKKALIKVDPVPVLIFDEIDAQIGGRLGTVTGEKLKELSFSRQVILITHLPQIASFADKHFKIQKKVEGNRTLASIKLLDNEEQVKELAKMMSGEKETGIALTHAREMLNKAKKLGVGG